MLPSSKIFIAGHNGLVGSALVRSQVLLEMVGNEEKATRILPRMLRRAQHRFSRIGADKTKNERVAISGIFRNTMVYF